MAFRDIVLGDCSRGTAVVKFRVAALFRYVFDDIELYGVDDDSNKRLSVCRDDTGGIVPIYADAALESPAGGDACIDFCLEPGFVGVFFNYIL
jgi:hypothetical protein